MQYALVLGATGKNSLGRACLSGVIDRGFVPVLVGRTAPEAVHSLSGVEALGITADLTDPDVVEQIIEGIPDLSAVSLVMVAGGGPHLKGTVGEHSSEQQLQLWRSITEGPMRLLSAFHAQTTQPYHLITVASTSAMVVRQDETWYATAQAVRRSFALNFHHELAERGGKSLVVCPGGMKTGLWASSPVETDNFMNPDVVASLVWEHADQQLPGDLKEIVIRRDPQGTPQLQVVDPR